MLRQVGIGGQILADLDIRKIRLLSNTPTHVPALEGFDLEIVEPRDLLRTPIICNPAPSHLYRAVHEWFAAGDCVPERITTCNSMTIMTRLAAVGFGVAILPTSVLRNEFELGALRPLRTDPVAGMHDLLFAHLASLSPVIVNAVRDIATQLVRTSDLLKG